MKQLTVDFYNVSSDTKYVTKKLSMLLEGKVFYLKSMQNTLDVHISTTHSEDEIENAHYCYIREFGKYYFITSKDYDTGNQLILNLHEDVLQCFDEGLRNLYAFVERQEFKYNPYFHDELLPVRVNRVIGSEQIGNIGNPSGNNVVITVTSA